MAQVTQTGGRNLKRIIDNAKKAQGVQSIDVGFLPGDRYDDDDKTPVAHVAVQHEFGNEHVPERPFMRQGAQAALPDVSEVLSTGIEGETLRVTPALAERVGEVVAESVKRAIELKQTPRNAPATRKQKGRDDPLKDTGRMVRSVKTRVNE